MSPGNNKRKVGGTESSRKVQKKEVNGNDDVAQDELPVKMEPLDIGMDDCKVLVHRAELEGDE